MKPALLALLSAILHGTATAAGGGASPMADYAVVVSQSTATNDAWTPVVETLVQNHRANTITFAGSIQEALPALRKQFPRYVAFVAAPEEVSREYVRDIHRMMRHLDDDPYADGFWGIVTGYDAANALRIARQRDPLTIRKVASGTELAMEMVDQGVFYSEVKKNRMVRKESGKPAAELEGPDDTTALLAQSLNDFQADLFVTSGHATERDWQIGFNYRNGYFRHTNGALYGEDARGGRFPIQSPNPKVYLPIGNCLMGHIDKPDCMATAWLNSAGVCQMLGYIQPTWYGYLGWGVLDYFVEQPGRYTLTEAFFANHAALVHRLTTFFPELAATETDAAGRLTTASQVGDRAKAAGLTRTDAHGLLFDRDMVAFYGDPAWQARLMEQPRAFDQQLTSDHGTFTFLITPQHGSQSFQPINLNGSQRGGRPFVAFLPQRVRNVKVLEGADLDPVITDDFILVPNPRACDPTRPYRVRFSAEPIARYLL